MTERERLREREHKQGGVGEGEAGFLPSREPDVGLDPRIVTRAEGRRLMTEPPRRPYTQLFL